MIDVLAIALGIPQLTSEELEAIRVAGIECRVMGSVPLPRGEHTDETKMLIGNGPNCRMK